MQFPLLLAFFVLIAVDAIKPHYIPIVAGVLYLNRHYWKSDIDNIRKAVTVSHRAHDMKDNIYDIKNRIKQSYAHAYDSIHYRIHPHHRKPPTLWEVIRKRSKELQFSVGKRKKELLERIFLTKEFSENDLNDLLMLID
jgi:hypothetical protein